MEEFNTSIYIDHLSLDCVIFGYQNRHLKVLIAQYKFNSKWWSLPGGYVLKTENLDDAAKRVLKERTSLHEIYLSQFYAFGAADRIVGSTCRNALVDDLYRYNPYQFTPEVLYWITSRFISIGYYALVDCKRVTPLPGTFESKLCWVNFTDIPELMHDHNTIVIKALYNLRQNLDEKLLVFNLLPETFTMKEIRDVYEAIYDRDFPMNNFQKKVLDLGVLERVGKKYSGGPHRAPYLYRFCK